MATLLAGKLNQISGPPDGGGVYPSVSTTWGVDGSDFLNNGVISLPKIAGTVGFAVVQNAAGQWGYADLTAPVDSVAGKTGVVTLVSGDVGLGNVSNDAQIIKAIGTTKGDIVVYTGSNTPIRLPVGSDAQVLTADNLEASGIKWAAAAGGGATDGVSGAVQFSDGAGAHVSDENNFFWDNTGKRLAIGHDNPTNILHVKSNSSSRFDRTTSTANDVADVFLVKRTSSVNISDGFGLNIPFLIEDNTSGGKIIGKVEYVRDGDDDKGKLNLKVGLNGNVIGMSINSSLVVDFPGTVTHTHFLELNNSSLFERTTATTNDSGEPLVLKRTSSGTTSDPFGVNLPFVIDDATNPAKIIGKIGFVRDGAINKGKFIVLAGTNGVEEFLSVNATGVVKINQLTASRMITTNGSSELVALAPSSAYTRNATIVEDRTLLASGSATIINNNNVLAGLIADLQAANVLG